MGFSAASCNKGPRELDGSSDDEGLEPHGSTATASLLGHTLQNTIRWQKVCYQLPGMRNSTIVPVAVEPSDPSWRETTSSLKD
jgi:hypothetical protein